MDGYEDVYLMSIRPQYAKAILAGRKRFELRRLDGLPRIGEGSVIVIYASGKLKSILGEFRARRVYEAAPEKVWAMVQGPGTGVGRDAWDYIKGARRAMAIEVGERLVYQRPVTLEEVRRIIPGWMPPYSYKRLADGDPIYELVIKPLRAASKSRQFT